MHPLVSGPGIRSVAGLLATGLLVAACSSSGSGGYSAPSVAASVAASVAVGSAAPTASAAGGGDSGSGDDYSRGGGSPAVSAAASPVARARTIAVAVGTGAPGSYLTGDGGMTLYVFTPDSANTSTCSGGCAATWPPFTIGAGDTLEPDAAISGSLTTFVRADGSLQVAHDGAPLYYFASDAKPGDTTGQGAAGKWFVAEP